MSLRPDVMDVLNLVRNMSELEAKLLRLFSIQTSPRLYIDTHFVDLVRRIDLLTENAFVVLDQPEDKDVICEETRTSVNQAFERPP